MNADYTIHKTKLNHKTQYETRQVDLKSTPYTLDDSTSKGVAYLVLFFGAFWSLIPFVILIKELGGHKFTSELAIIVGLLLTIGAGVISYGFHLLTAKRVITFHKEVLEIYTKTFLKGKNNRTLPYTAFKGVLMGEYIMHRKDQSDLTFQAIELVHDDKALTVKLFEKLGTTPPRALWKEYIEFMRIPALQKDGDILLEAHHDDIDLTLQQRSKREYAKADTFSADNIPQGLKIKHENGRNGNEIHIRIETNRLTLAILALFTLVPAVFVALPLFVQEISLIFPAAGALFLLVIGGMALQDHKNKREILMTRTEISIEDMQPQNTHEKTVTKLTLNSIENILIKGESLNKHLVIIGKEGEMSTNTGLSDETLKWLQSYLRAAVVTA